MNIKRITGSKRNAFVAKSALIGMLVIGFGTGSVFASGEASAPISSSAVAIDLPVEKAVSESKEKTPTLLPGDFFYFIKVVYENIRLSIEADDVKDAGLLAEFAQERLSEAAALHAKGETAKSEQALQKSFENQQNAIELVASEAEDENEEKDIQQAVGVKSDLQHNILALTAALEKVENPQAQKSLLKNIIKSFGKLEKKLAKLENKAPEEQASETMTKQAEDSSQSKTDTVVSSDAKVNTTIKSETKQKTVLDKKTKLEKDTKNSESKIKEAKSNAAKAEKKEEINKERNVHNERNGHNNKRNEKNHDSK
ncbi:DUF5667 domain-containing protein [Paenibacillus sp. LHD-38]|uniref:DUF5667 domain-containing protein n=1 Tax=Paenibacillus sp. LHD-38 TaxID=3072143 RepID=UPI0028103B83|nr:DUF5667 domain-containing protein [Paenibacillus sp. LHD-38]MDQ8734965.1 DUF5667 domain-containing protein [Paenibacillus sp. LHD-38]